MTIHVVDSIMGSGKSRWAFQYMNEHPEKRFIYIAFFNDECDRACQECRNAHLNQPLPFPSKHYNFMVEVSENHSIATTHELFRTLELTPESIEDIRSRNYTIILDETVETVQVYDGIKDDDFKRLTGENGWIRILENGTLELTESGAAVTDSVDMELLNLVRTRSVFLYGDKVLMWSIPPDLFQLSQEIYILTYLFESSHLKHTLCMYGYEYDKYYVEGNPYRLVQGSDPNEADRKAHFMELIDLLDGEDADGWNDIFQERSNSKEHVYSGGWWGRATSRKKEIARNKIRNYFRTKATGQTLGVKQCMWAVIGQTQKTAVKDRRLDVDDYNGACVAYNERARNCYSQAIALAYFTNVFERPPVYNWFKSKGQKLDNDLFALSTLLQWIWRSAIRNDQPIHLYIPSKRMRILLRKWLNNEHVEEEN